MLAVTAVCLIEIDEGELLPVVAELSVLFVLDLVDPAEIAGGGDRVILGGGQFRIFLPDVLCDVRERQGFLSGDFLDLVVILLRHMQFFNISIFALEVLQADA